MRRCIARGIATAALGISIFAAGTAHAAFIASGDLLVVQSGDGSAALASSATAAFLKEYATAGTGQTALSSTALPTAGSGSNKRLTLSGTATSEGFLQMSPDGKYLAV